MDPLAFLIAHDATRTGIQGAEPWDRPQHRQQRRRRRADNRSGRVR